MLDLGNWAVMDARPLRRVAAMLAGAPFTRRAWREVAACATGAVGGLLGFALVGALLVPALLLTVSVVGTVPGLLLGILALRLARGFGALHRRLLGALTGTRIPAPRPLASLRGIGPLARVDRRVRDRDAWRAAVCLPLRLPLAYAQAAVSALAFCGLADVTYPLWWPLFRNHPPGTRLTPLHVLGTSLTVSTWAGTVVALLIGAGLVFAAVWLAWLLCRIDIRLARWLLGPSRVAELERTRAIAVRDAMAELRRVERDLHDGAQVHLAAVAMNLGMAMEKAQAEDLRELLDSAQSGVAATLAELRRIARGIHPPVLDSGLPDALASLVASSPVPATVVAELPRHPAQPIETIAYFCAAELLTNAIKHSSASWVTVTVGETRPGTLRLRVADNGRGGARVSEGGGLAGLRERVSVVDGSLEVSSPTGGPTEVTIDLPMSIDEGGARDARRDS
jgi:signal transduction histidine kinase